MASPKISISCPTTWHATIFEDIRNYRAAGATGIGLWEFKFEGHDDGKIKEAMTSGTLVTALPEVLELVDATGRPNVKVIVDVWHYWDIPDGLASLRDNAGRLVGVQVNDWREPTRGWCDRVLPGDGGIGLRAFFRTLTQAGYDGWYDIEVFSDDGLFGNGYPDSVWARPAAQVAREAVEKFMYLWNTQEQGS